ncbi:MAG: hypothetical protein ACK5DJ_02825 [Bacteroidota bacterium]
MVISWAFKSCVKFKSAVWALFGFLVVSTFISCEKGPGEGGSSAIVGNVEVDDFQNGETYPGVDEDVYLIYGDDITYSERIKSSFDGRFEFKYLREGSYTVYVYSDTLTAAGSTAVKKSIEITGRKQEVDAGTFQIKKY